MKRTEVLEIQTLEISPLQSALADVKTKTAELSGLKQRYEYLTSESETINHALLTDTNPLSMALNSAVDTGLAGGIPLYRRAFFDSGFVAANTDKIDLIEELRSGIDEQVRTSKFISARPGRSQSAETCGGTVASCLLLHQKLSPPEMATFHSTLVKCKLNDCEI